MVETASVSEIPSRQSRAMWGEGDTMPTMAFSHSSPLGAVVKEMFVRL